MVIYQTISKQMQIHLIVYFLIMADKIIDNNRNHKIGKSNYNNPLGYMHQIFKHPFPNIKFKYIATNENEKIIK